MRGIIDPCPKCGDISGMCKDGICMAAKEEKAYKLPELVPEFFQICTDPLVVERLDLDMSYPLQYADFNETIGTLFTDTQIREMSDVMDIGDLVGKLECEGKQRWIAVGHRNVISKHLRCVPEGYNFYEPELSTCESFLGIPVIVQPGMPKNIIALVPPGWNGNTLEDVHLLIIEEENLPPATKAESL